MTERRRTDLVLALGTAAWVAIVFAAFYPGLMSKDSVDQFGEGLARTYSNGHPPAHSALIGLCARAVGSPWPLLLLDLTVIAGGMALLARRARSRGALVLWALFLLVPPTWAIGNTIWKDVAMAAFLLLAVVALAHRRPRWAGLALLAATLMRHNALFGAAPLLVPMVSQALPEAKRWARWAAVAGGCVLLVFAPAAFDRLVGARQQCMICAVAENDLAGIYVQDPTGFQSSVLAPFMTLEQLRQFYTHSGNGYLYRYMTTEQQVELLPVMPEWKAAAVRRPGLLLRNKLATFAVLLGFQSEVFYPFHTTINANPWGLKLSGSDALYRSLCAVEAWAHNGPFFRGALWLALALGLALVGLRRRQSLPMWIALSGAAYAFGFLPVGSSSDFRYLYWTIVSCFAAGVLLLERR